MIQVRFCRSLSHFAFFVGLTLIFPPVGINVAQAQDLSWAIRAGGTLGGESSNGIAVDDDGNAFVTGSFHNGAVFGAGDPNETTFANSGGPGGFVAKYDANGVLDWVAPATGVLLSTPPGAG